MRRRDIILGVMIFLLCAAASFAKCDGLEYGVLWSSQEPALMPNIQGSVSVWEDAGWQAYVDTYFAIDLSSVGAGFSIASPPTTPVFSTFLSVLQADRAGPAVGYQFDEGEWSLNFVCIYEIR